MTNKSINIKDVLNESNGKFNLNEVIRLGRVSDIDFQNHWLGQFALAMQQGMVEAQNVMSEFFYEVFDHAYEQAFNHGVAAGKSQVKFEMARKTKPSKTPIKRGVRKVRVVRAGKTTAKKTRKVGYKTKGGRK